MVAGDIPSEEQRQRFDHCKGVCEKHYHLGSSGRENAVSEDTNNLISLGL